MTHSARHLAVLAAVVALAGCGALNEHLSMGEWRELGEARPPVDALNGGFVVTTIVPGQGPVVGAGDLVKARVVVTTVDMAGETPLNPSPQVIWVWTGRGPQVDDQDSVADLNTFGWLGGERPRGALIGRHLHEQFEMHLGAGARPDTGDLPLRGIIDFPASRLEARASIKGQLAIPLEWPAVALRGQGGGNPAARIEILAICPGARLYRRTATLRQFGPIFSTGDVKYANSRKGTLGWTALDAQCPAPDGHVRFEAGPFYYSRLHDPELLAYWSQSYQRLRPPADYPQEWHVVPKTADEIIDERLAAITDRIEVLTLQGEGHDEDCQTLKKCEDPQKREARRLERQHLMEEAARRRKQLECELKRKCGEAGGR